MCYTSTEVRSTGIAPERRCACEVHMKGVMLVITHNKPVDSPTSSVKTTLSLREQRARLRQLRHELILRYRPTLQQGAGPIRALARMVGALARRCRVPNIAEETQQAENVTLTPASVR